MKKHHLVRRGLALCAAGSLCLGAQAEGFGGCVPVAEGEPVAVTRAGADKPIRAVFMGRSPRAVVFSNTAYDAPCAWLGVARELVSRGYGVALWRYNANERGRGANRVVLAGGSRGGCLSMMAATEIQPPVDGVVVLSCAAVFNRRSPTPTAPFAAKLSVPLLHVTGEGDTTPTLAEARDEFERFPVRDKQLVVLPTAAHGDQLLNNPEDGARALPAIVSFLSRVMPGEAAR